MAVTVALLPALFTGGGSPSTAVAAGAAREGRVITQARTAAELAPPTTSTSTTAPTTSTTSTPRTTVVKVKAAAVTRPAAVHRATTTTIAPRPRRTTTTTAAPRQATPAPTPSAHGSESGRATWYDYQPGICAHRTLPFGTVVTVHAVNGKSVQCTVGDRGPYVDGYVIDLNQREFEQLAPTSAGRIDVTITW